VLDALFATDEPLGTTWQAGLPTLRLWAPTARAVRLHLFAGPRDAQAVEVVDMVKARGVWTVRGAAGWKWRYYLYEVSVYTPATGRIETSLVTDPYSRSLAQDSKRSQLVDLDDPAVAGPARRLAVGARPPP